MKLRTCLWKIVFCFSIAIRNLTEKNMITVLDSYPWHERLDFCLRVNILNNGYLIKTRKEHFRFLQSLLWDFFFPTCLRLRSCLPATYDINGSCWCIGSLMQGTAAGKNGRIHKQETLTGQTVPCGLWSFCAWWEAVASFG